MSLLHGKGHDTPSWVETDLKRFGRNPHGDNIYRVVWSERKMLMLDGELFPEYDPPHHWILEKWLAPEQYAGSEVTYNMTEQRMGPYPRGGEWVEVSPQPFVPGVPLTKDVLNLVCTLIERGKAYTAGERAAALKERQDKIEAEQFAHLQQAILEVQDSASMGRTQQAVTGPINKFRTVEDWERDNADHLSTKDLKHMPARAGVQQF